MRVNETRALNPGRLRHRITWQRKTPTEAGINTYGEAAYEWARVVVVSAQVMPLQGRELDAARQRWAEAQYRIEQHYVPGLAPFDRIEWVADRVTTKYLDVLDVQNAGGVGMVQVVIAKEWVA